MSFMMGSLDGESGAGSCGCEAATQDHTNDLMVLSA
ncbi:hypothetical protein EDD32_3577 [Georgenia muralis]|uniref:Uncharacterized protein n=1 Tax=Georgenia muralis TaxID=154117 RepID=A0A3N5A6K4_9MICO|nr:hypothetical protein EDD32_3577 [Georgenia muralis]